MSNNKSVLYVLAIVGTLIGLGAGYFYANNRYGPIVDDLQLSLAESTSDLEKMSEEMITVNELVEEKDTMILSLDEQVSRLEEEFSTLEGKYLDTFDELNAAEKSLKQYKQLAFDFYKTTPIRIGLISPTDIDEPIVRAIADLAEQDIHRYCKENGLPYRFEFVISNNQGLESLALGNTITYDTIGVNMVVGHWWDISVASTLKYINDNDMLMLSPSSSSSMLAVEDDNLFRLTPNNTMKMDVVVKCMKELGKEQVIILAENSEWGRELVDEYRPKIGSLGLSVNDTVWYPEDPGLRTSSLVKFSRVVEAAYLAYGRDVVCVYVLGWDVLEEAIGYDYVSEVSWFGTDVFTMFPSFSGKSAKSLEKVKLLSPRPGFNSSLFEDFRTRVYDICDYYPSIYGASAYDACWLYALSIIETGSTNFTRVKEVLPVISNGYVGVSGDCSLNGAGDKLDSDYRIMGFERIHLNEAELVDYGYYNSTTREITWIRDIGLN